MYITKKIKQSLQSEISKLKAMTLEDVKWYIWEYYKIPIALLMVLLIFGAIILSNVMNPEKVYLQNLIINISDIDQVAPVALDTEFKTAAGLGKQDVIYNTGFYLSTGESVSNNDYMQFQRIMVMATACDLDLVLTNQETINKVFQMEILGDLEDILPADLWSQVKNNAVYLMDEVSGQVYAAALDISNSAVIKKCGLHSDSVVVAVCVTTESLPHCIEMIRYLVGVPSVG